MLKDAQPSEYFLGAILRAYDKTRAAGAYPVTCSLLWNHVVRECLQGYDRFTMMFEWDKSRAKKKNRIRTISETIGRGFVPGLCLSMDGKGREIVVPDRNEVEKRVFT